MKINDVLKKHEKLNPKILLKIKRGSLILEGDADGLTFLGNLILAHAEGNDCGFQISPKGAGKKYFSPNARIGIYLHRVPCSHERKKTENRKRDE